MKTRSLSHSDLPLILNIKHTQAREQGLSLSETNLYLAKLKRYLDSHLDKDVKMYGVVGKDIIFALLTTQIQQTPLETTIKIIDFYTRPNHRNRHYQSERIIPILCIDAKKMGINTIEADHQANPIAYHLITDTLALKEEKTTYYRAISTVEYSYIPPTLKVIAKPISENSYLLELQTQYREVLIVATISISNLPPTPTKDTSTEGTISICRISRIITNDETKTYEQILLKYIFTQFANSNIDFAKIVSFYNEESVLENLGFTKNTNTMRGSNILLNVRLSPVFKI